MFWGTFSGDKVPQSASLSGGRGVQKLFGQCPNATCMKLRGASLPQAGTCPDQIVRGIAPPSSEHKLSTLHTFEHMHVTFYSFAGSPDMCNRAMCTLRMVQLQTQTMNAFSFCCSELLLIYITIYPDLPTHE